MPQNSTMKILSGGKKYYELNNKSDGYIMFQAANVNSCIRGREKD